MWYLLWLYQFQNVHPTSPIVLFNKSTTVQKPPVVLEKSARGQTKTLKWKRRTLFSTLSVLTLQSISQLPELTASVTCIQKQQLYHENEILKYHEASKGWALITSLTCKNSINATVGGVGMLLSLSALISLISIEKTLPRIMIANFSGNPSTTVILHYSPTNVSKENNILDFYKELSVLARVVLKYNVKKYKDFSAHIRKICINKRTTYHEITNRSGNHLQEFAIENGLVIL